MRTKISYEKLLNNRDIYNHVICVFLEESLSTLIVAYLKGSHTN